MKKKKLVFNNKGMILYSMLLLTSILLASVDSANIMVFIITKIIAISILTILMALYKYIPSKYID